MRVASRAGRLLVRLGDRTLETVQPERGDEQDSTEIQQRHRVGHDPRHDALAHTDEGDEVSHQCRRPPEPRESCKLVQRLVCQ